MKPKADADNGSACAKPNPATNNQICGRIKKILPSPDNTDLTARKLFKRGNKNVIILKVPTVLWSRSNFDRLRLPAPGEKKFTTQIYRKNSDLIIIIIIIKIFICLQKNTSTVMFRYW